MTDYAPGQLTVALSGSSGLVGTRLRQALTAAGHKVIALVRTQPNTTDQNSRYWNPDCPDPAVLDNVDVVVHLAGASIMGRFTNKHRQAIRQSRITPTRRLAELVADTPSVHAMVCASAVGYYGYDVTDAVTESHGAGTGFLAEVCADWEAACDPARAADKRVVSIRTGLVLDGSGGILKVLVRLTKTGLNGPLGGGDQWFAWVGASDLCAIYLQAVTDPTLTGPVNAVGPELITNADFTRALGSALRRPTLVPVPAVAAMLVLGRVGARELALASQKVVPEVLQRRGYRFQHSTVSEAICAELLV